jgi:hypothetical protein
LRAIKLLNMRLCPVRPVHQRVEFLKAFQEIVLQCGKRAARRGLASDNDNIQTGFDLAWQYGVDTGAKAASGAVSDHRIADFAAGGKTDPDDILAVFTRWPDTNLNDHPWRRPFTVRPSDSQKLTSLFEANETGLSGWLGHAGAETTATP